MTAPPASPARPADAPLPPLLFEPTALLAPLPGPDPAGPNLRYDRVMADIRHAREADDPHLPLGDWTRPLKKADWPGVVLLGTHVLRERSKDLQVAAWLTDAWVHLHGLAGLRAGLTVLIGLVEQHWAGLHPRIDDGDAEARVAPLAWLNEALPVALRVDVTLMHWSARRPPRITLDDWDRSLRAEDTPENPRRSRTPPPEPAQRPPTRQDLLTASLGEPLADLLARRREVREVAGEWARLDQLLDRRLSGRGPSLARVAETLEHLGRALDALIRPRQPVPPATPEAPPAPVAAPTPSTEPPMTDPDATASAPAAAPAAPAALPLRSRTEAYAALQRIADFLQQQEPHSPTPYLIRRAVRWGQLPLPELMKEMLREEGDVNRLMRLLGAGDKDKA